MVDVVSQEVRSRMMAGIRGKNTKPEMLVRRFLHAKGFRYRLHDKALPGKPDMVLPRYQTVIFVHGCFWHRHLACQFATTPSTNRSFWLKKFEKNEVRDRLAAETLISLGWKVIILWECGLRSGEAAECLAWLPLQITKGTEPLLHWPKQPLPCKASPRA